MHLKVTTAVARRTEGKFEAGVNERRSRTVRVS